MGAKLLESSLVASRTSIGRGTRRFATSFALAEVDAETLRLPVGVPSLLGTVFLVLYLEKRKFRMQCI